MAIPTLIYCAGGNPRFYEIAMAAGFEYGSQLPETVYGPLHFADQDWKKPNREAYMAALAEHTPHMASVLDLECEEQLPEVLSWAEEAAAFVAVVMIVPKACGIIERLPRRIAGADIRLGYSVPTKFGGTFVPVWEFAGWAVHLLGGSPQKQKTLTYYLNVASVDGNMHQKMATRHCRFWVPGNARYASHRWWPALQECDGEKWGDGSSQAGAPYEAFRRSCENIMKMWKGW